MFFLIHFEIMKKSKIDFTFYYKLNNRSQTTKEPVCLTIENNSLRKIKEAHRSAKSFSIRDLKQEKKKIVYDNNYKKCFRTNTFPYCI